jgi:hypothetical protein
MTTEAQTAANRRNAAKSTGPRTTVGKAVVAQNAIKHGLLARQNVIPGEDLQEFELHRRGLLEELEPAGRMEALLTEHIVSLTWRLRRAERVQNEVFDSLLAEELRNSMSGFYDELTPKDEVRLTSDPRTDPSYAVGRMVSKDFHHDRVLERLLTYERQIEGCLHRTMADLEHLKLKHKADGGDRAVHGPLVCRVPPAASDSAKQSQSQTSQEDHRQASLDAATRDAASDSAKQSQSGGTATGVGAMPRCVRRAARHSHNVPHSY